MGRSFSRSANRIFASAKIVQLLTMAISQLRERHLNSSQSCSFERPVAIDQAEAVRKSVKKNKSREKIYWQRNADQTNTTETNYERQKKQERRKAQEEKAGQRERGCGRKDHERERDEEGGKEKRFKLICMKVLRARSRNRGAVGHFLHFFVSKAIFLKQFLARSLTFLHGDCTVLACAANRRQFVRDNVR